MIGHLTTCSGAVGGGFWLGRRAVAVAVDPLGGVRFVHQLGDARGRQAVVVDRRQWAARYAGRGGVAEPLSWSLCCSNVHGLMIIVRQHETHRR